MIPNEDKVGWNYLAVKKLLTLLRVITKQIINVSRMKTYVKRKIFAALFCKHKG